MLENNKILLVSQTTFNSFPFSKIANILKEKAISNNLVIKNIISLSTENRQKETEEISKKVDVMIIVGDKKSSNTNKLYDISKVYCSNVLFIEDETELDYSKIKEAKSVGIMADNCSEGTTSN